MNVLSRLAPMAALAVLFAGCSGPGGILDNPSGNIILTDQATGATFTTSATDPYIIPANGLHFAIGIYEQHFAGPYDIKIVAEHNEPTELNGGTIYPFAFNEPCFTVTTDTTFTNATVVASFSATNANGNGYSTSVSGGVGSGNPCHSGEFEQATISDTKGHTLNFYYEEQ